MPRITKEDETWISVRLSKHLSDALEEQAASRGCSKSGFLVYLLQQELKRQDSLCALEYLAIQLEQFTTVEQRKVISAFACELAKEFMKHQPVEYR